MFISQEIGPDHQVIVGNGFVGVDEFLRVQFPPQADAPSGQSTQHLVPPPFPPQQPIVAPTGHPPILEECPSPQIDQPGGARFKKRPSVYVFSILNGLYGCLNVLAGIGVLLHWMSIFNSLELGHFVMILNVWFYGCSIGIYAVTGALVILFSRADPKSESGFYHMNNSMKHAWFKYIGWNVFFVLLVMFFNEKALKAIPLTPFTMLVLCIWIAINVGYHNLAHHFLKDPFVEG